MERVRFDIQLERERVREIQKQRERKVKDTREQARKTKPTSQQLSILIRSPSASGDAQAKTHSLDHAPVFETVAFVTILVYRCDCIAS